MKIIYLNKKGESNNIEKDLDNPVFVNDEDFEYLNQFNWHAVRINGKFYAARYVRIDGKQTNIEMHREIMGIIDNIEYDHVDRNGLNNQRYNLRKCTRSQNNANRKFTNRHGYKGISKVPNGKWVAKIYKNNNAIHIGTFNTKELAAKAYDIKAEELYGEFANLNFK